MTTVRKPVPPHGTYARANGSRGYRAPCKCEPCLVERRRYKKHDNASRQLGRPGHVDATQARERLLLLKQTVGWNDLAAAIGGSAANLRDIAFGRRLRIKRTTHHRIMQISATPSGGQYIDATGSARRLRALQAIGHTTYTIADVSNTSRSLIVPILDGRGSVRRVVAERIEAAYRELSKTPGSAARSMNRAKREGWAPPAAWDDELIDDPNAAPDWTGCCGTDRGYWMHKRQQLPLCERCKQAHADWLDERADLPVQQLNRARFAARAAASHREADLAHDARELLRLEVGIEQVAERLGVTRNHLQQALLRNPETTEAVAA
ncbi:hypothetical protein [Streptomyces triticiradicis]|uniref:Helix-turn-helix DNA binding domain protein n=1 Tax=Streptomyces triticiradicis TaxID=2651189 RepID=A0A7J5D7L3_9ACTN|nr:hypothetical protein [Streptomyces triticiradicis]KAB1979259.1 hypothetical protein F8144_36455 [Streptomyces triticiradicis]